MKFKVSELDSHNSEMRSSLHDLQTKLQQYRKSYRDSSKFIHQTQTKREFNIYYNRLGTTISANSNELINKQHELMVEQRQARATIEENLQVLFTVFPMTPEN
jgi:hypothetical protein